jgi:hypothetical protein
MALSAITDGPYAAPHKAPFIHSNNNDKISARISPEISYLLPIFFANREKP